MVSAKGTDVGKRVQSQGWRIQIMARAGTRARSQGAKRRSKTSSSSLKKPQKSLKNWTKQKWRTKSGKPSTQGSKATGERYLPEKAIKSLSPQEYAATTRKKRKDTKAGRQHSAQPRRIANKTRRTRTA
jgi:hypothetical protein